MGACFRCGFMEHLARNYLRNINDVFAPNQRSALTSRGQENSHGGSIAKGG